MSKWIKCSDRLPKIEKVVLCLKYNKDVFVGFMDESGTWDEIGTWDYTDYRSCMTGITHWMTLPKLPINGENK